MGLTRRLRSFFLRLWSSIFDRGWREELDAEFAANVELNIAENLQAGMTPLEARRAAQKRFGKTIAAADLYHDRKTLPGVEDLLRDLRHGARFLWRDRGFSIPVVSALALGIGANTAIFSVVNSVLLTPLDLEDADRIVQLRTASPTGSYAVTSQAKFTYMNLAADAIELMSASKSGVVNYSDGVEPAQVQSLSVSRDYFELYGVHPFLGRTFTAQEDSPGGPKVAIVSRAFWERRLDSDPKAVGHKILLGGAPHVVIGVLDGKFEAPEMLRPPDVWIPMQLNLNGEDLGHSFEAVGRLRPGVSLQRANSRLRVASNAFVERFAGALPPNQFFSAIPLREAMVGDVRYSLIVLCGAVGLVLLIACANAANLLLARAAGRSREIALRVAIGAGRGRIIRQLLTESVLLSAVAGAIGLLLGVWGIRTLLSLNPVQLPRLDGAADIAVDWRVLVFALAASVVTGVVFGLVPALQSSKTRLVGALNAGGGRSGSAFGQHRARSFFVIAEVAVALVLLVGSVLLIRTSIEIARVDPGFDASNVLTMRMSVAEDRFADSRAVDLLIRQGSERLNALPGVEIATASYYVPLQDGSVMPFIISGRPLKGRRHGLQGWTSVSPGYFDVFRIRLKRGRSFNERDDAAAPPVVMINEAMARKYWPDSDPLNSRLLIGSNMGPGWNEDPERQIVGIVGDVRDTGLARDPRPRMYVPQAQVVDHHNAANAEFYPLAWLIRTKGSSPELVEQIDAELRQVSGLAPTQVSSMQQIIAGSLAQRRFHTWLMSVFGFVALLLTAIGVYSLMAYAVQRQTREIGIRLALGARLGQVRAMVVGQGMRLVGAGLAIGLIGAFALSRSIANLLYGVDTQDPVTFAGVPIALCVVALLAVWIPARRAARVEPQQALRFE